MWIFCSMLFVSMSLVITSRCYKKICPGIKLISSELVLFPFRLKIYFQLDLQLIWSSPDLDINMCLLVNFLGGFPNPIFFFFVRLCLTLDCWDLDLVGLTISHFYVFLKHENTRCHRKTPKGLSASRKIKQPCLYSLGGVRRIYPAFSP